MILKYVLLSLSLVCISPGFSQESTAPQHPQQAFDYAWKQFTAGNYTEAEAKTDEALAISQTPGIRARWHYLKAYLLTKQKGMAAEALAHFNDASTLYEQVGNDRGVELAEMGTVKLLINEGETQLAKSRLNALISDNENLSSPGYASFLLARLAYEDGNLEGGLKLAQSSLKSYLEKNDATGVAQAYTQIGLFKLLLGKYEDGFEDTLEGQRKTLKQGKDANHYIYSLVNFIIYHRCVNGKEPARTIQTIRKHLEKEYDKDLANLLEEALKLNCPERSD